MSEERDNAMSGKSLRILSTAAVAAGVWFGCFSAAPVAAQTRSSGPASTGGAAAPSGPLVSGGLEQNGNLRLMVNKSVTLTTSRPYKRLSVGQPDIADVNGIGPTRI